MDGKTLLYQVRQLLEEDSGSSFLDDFLTYQFINEAAVEFCRRTLALTATQSITTVADQEEYTLNADYMGLYLKNNSNNFYLKYSDGTNSHFINWKSYEDVIYQNNTTSVSIPDRFTVIDKATLASPISSEATAAGDKSGGECTLTDTNSDFSDVFAGDIVHNVTDVSDGVVTSKTSTTALKTALFNGTDNEWDDDDDYVIQPQGRYQLIFDPPPSTAAHTATLYYIQRPAPVYSDYGAFRFQSHSTPALTRYAAWLYKYRDKDPNFGDKWYQFFEDMIRKSNNQIDHIKRRKNFRVSLKGRR